MNDSTTVRRSERKNKGIPPARLMDMEQQQIVNSKPNTPKNGAQNQNSNTPQKGPQVDVSKQIMEMQREFQRQMTALHNLIVANNNQTKSSINELRQEFHAAQTANSTSENMQPQNNAGEERIPGESNTNCSFHSQCSHPIAAKKIYPLPKFEGHPETWQIFYEDFRATTAEFEYTDLQNIIRIREAIQGAARETVESLLSSSKNVKAIIEVLKETYGRPEVLIKSQIQKVRMCQPVLEGRLDQIVTFANKVNNMAMFLKSVEGNHHLSNPSLLSELVSKLPPSKQMQWAEKCFTMTTAPTILDFSEWLNCMRRLANMVSDALPSTSTEAAGRRQQFNSAQKGNKYAMVSVSEKKCLICQGGCRYLHECDLFQGVNVDERWKKVKELRLCFCCLKPYHQVNSCFAKNVCGINQCTRKHNRLLHKDEINQTEENVHCPDERVSCHVDKRNVDVLFQIIPIKLYHQEKEVSIYAFIDDGANATMLDWEVARQLGMKGKPDTLKLQWLNSKSISERTEVIDIVVSPHDNTNEKYNMRKVYLINNLELPTQSILKRQLAEKYSTLKNMPIIDYVAAKPKMIISIAHAYLTVPTEIPTNTGSGPFVIKCKLGVVVYGPLEETNKNTKMICCTNAIESNTSDDQMKEMMEKYFEVESCGVKLNTKPVVPKYHERAIEIMHATTKYVGDRYECGLLWKFDNIDFPSSYQMALNRYDILQKKFKKDKAFEEEYTERMDDLFRKGYAKRLSSVETQISPKTFFLPHFAVRNPNKGKIRIVFDAAAKAHGISLNDRLLTGPNLNNSLISVLYKFREFPVAVCGDIREMFLQVAIRGEDINAQRFLWKSEKDKNTVQQCVMKRLIFGAACSPTIAQHIKNENAKRFCCGNTRVMSAIIDRHYVDDYVDCFPSVSEAIAIVKEVQNIHKQAGFELCKIVSNSEQVMQNFEESPVAMVDVSADKVERILGLQWNPSTDEFIFILKYHRVASDVVELRRKPTKREALSIVMSTFDPFGFVANITVTGKIFMQSLWRLGMGWDDYLPDELYDRWIIWWREMKKVKDFRIPRCYCHDFNNTFKELHIFSDASELAMAVVAYWRIKRNDEYNVLFICGKTFVAPTKYKSVPRLELQAAVFAVRLKYHIFESQNRKVTRVQYWTDSNTVLRWIQSDARKYKQYVANRVGEILEGSVADEWKWVPGTMNPADDATRPLKTYNPENRWKNGPSFLLEPENTWPIMEIVNNEYDSSELRSKYYVLTAVAKNGPIVDFSRFSNFRRLKRAMAWALRFINNANVSKTKIRGDLNIEEESWAEKILCRLVQMSSFHQEYKCLEKKLLVDRSSDIKSLCPFLDEEGLMRVQGRLDNAVTMTYEARKPCILPKNHNFTDIVIKWYHCQFHHGNTSTVINEIRQKYWVPALRSAVNKVTSKCTKCKIRKAAPQQPIMGQLPVDRVTPYIRPFTYVGLDYFGPVDVTIRRQREKRWVALFTCLTIRAVHLEIATDLSSDACILCIRNFINRRGVPIQIRSDNGTNFVGLTKELSGEVGFLDHGVMQSKLVPLGIKWKFNTPSNPSAGGSWERLVQSVKRSLGVVLKEHAPRIDTLYSLLVETENIINSRPLTHLPVTPDEPEPITPNHFLLGCSSSTQTPGEYDHRACSSRKQWRLLQNFKNGLWKRWIKEYLPELTRRSKWFRPAKPIHIGCLVLLCDDNEPRSKWRRGRVVHLIHGKDGVARSAEIRTANGVLRRPVNKLAVLDVEESGESQPTVSTHGGEDVSIGD
ncbi:uncharacterized protein LOC142226001 [Haematobia irritans]|uniref:uncharacterized protein LOC142226001 n=1 Tax=Haematobia irritans TaxID=7368 RepID=UPI003F503275